MAQNQQQVKIQKLFIRKCLLKILVFLVYLAGVNYSHAQDSELIKIKNLSFNCKNCQLKQTDNYCDLILLDQGISFNCNQAIEHFFSVLKTSSESLNYPTSIELKNFIINKNEDKNLKINALQILLNNESGRKLFLEEITTFNQEANELYTAVIPFSYQHTEIWRAVWNSPNYNNFKLDAEIRSKIFAYIDIPNRDLFKDVLYPSLLDKDPNEQREIIEIYQANCRGKKSELIAEFAALNDFLENCGNISSILSKNECLEANVQNINEDILNLISKIKFNLVLNEINRGISYKSEDIINLLSKTNISLIRTPDSHRLLLQSIQTIAKNNVCEGKKVYYQYRNIFDEYKKYDKNLEEIIDNFSKQNCDLVEEKLEKNRSSLFLGLIALLVILLLLLIKTKRSKKDKELQSLLIYFGLTHREKDKLTETYYIFAKKLHPDSTSGNEELFKELNKNYEKLKKLWIDKH